MNREVQIKAVREARERLNKAMRELARDGLKVEIEVDSVYVFGYLFEVMQVHVFLYEDIPLYDPNTLGTEEPCDD